VRKSEGDEVWKASEGKSGYVREIQVGPVRSGEDRAPVWARAERKRSDGRSQPFQEVLHLNRRESNFVQSKRFRKGHIGWEKWLDSFEA